MMKRALLYMMMVGLIFTSCKKEEGPDGETTYIQSARDLASAENRTVRMFPVAYYMAKQYSWPVASRFSCATVSVVYGDTATWPATPDDSLSIQLDYGTGCTDADSTSKEGIVTIEYHGHPDSASSTIGLTYTGFKQEGWSFDGSMTYERSSLWGEYQIMDIAGNWWLGGDSVRLDLTGNINLVDTSTSMDLFGSHQWTANHSGTGVDINRVPFDIAPYLPLEFTTDCSWIKVGITDLRPEDYSWRSLDYGTSLCDNEATLIVGNNLYVFQIK